jgi:hypothetical protein
MTTKSDIARSIVGVIGRVERDVKRFENIKECYLQRL